MFRLKELRKEIGMSRAALSRALNINQGTLANYENELRQADYITLIVLAKFFDVSIDYLLGATDEFGARKSNLDKSAKEFDFIERNLINKYRELKIKSKDIVFTIIDHLHDLDSQ